MTTTSIFFVTANSYSFFNFAFLDVIHNRLGGKCPSWNYSLEELQFIVGEWINVNKIECHLAFTFFTCNYFRFNNYHLSWKINLYIYTSQRTNYNKFANFIFLKLQSKDVLQGNLFQKCTHLLSCSVLSLGVNVNTRRMSKPDMVTIFYIKKSMK